MNGNMISNGSTMADYMDVIVPLLIAEVVLVLLFSALYFLAVHTQIILREDIVERIFWAFRHVRKFTSIGFMVSFIMFYASLFMTGASAIALRDAATALFILVGYGGLFCGGWIYFTLKIRVKQKPARRKKRKK